MSWEAPIKDTRLIAMIPDYLAEYFKPEQGEISGFFSSIAERIKSGIKTVGRGIKGIGEGIYNLGYKVFRYSKKPFEVAFVGAKDTESIIKEEQIPVEEMEKVLSWSPSKEDLETIWSITPITPMEETKEETTSTGKKILKKIGRYVDDFMKTVAQVGGRIAGQLLMQKVAKAAKISDTSEQEIYNRALAWSIANQRQLQYIGYPSPEAAAASALWAKNGFPPSPKETPMDVLKPRPLYEEMNIEYYLKKYWWVIALFLTLLLYRRR